MTAPRTKLTIGQCGTLACLLEVNAPKPGNVHRGADFLDCTLNDFSASAVAIGPILDAQLSLGQTVEQCIDATQVVAGSNTNLGIVLLLAPLALVPRDRPIEDHVEKVIADSSRDDAQRIYQAIRKASAGGLELKPEEASDWDVNVAVPDHILDGMQEAADRDLIASQYANGFQEVTNCVVPLLSSENSASIVERIIFTHLTMMRDFPDSLIQRKCGAEVAAESAGRAAAVIDAGEVGSDAYVQALTDLDFWLRSDGHRRNPGTTADMIAAGLFVCLRDGLIQPPFR